MHLMRNLDRTVLSVSSAMKHLGFNPSDTFLKICAALLHSLYLQNAMTSSEERPSA